MKIIFWLRFCIYPQPTIGERRLSSYHGTETKSRMAILLLSLLLFSSHKRVSKEAQFSVNMQTLTKMSTSREKYHSIFNLRIFTNCYVALYNLWPLYIFSTIDFLYEPSYYRLSNVKCFSRGNIRLMVVVPIESAHSQTTS